MRYRVEQEEWCPVLTLHEDGSGIELTEAEHADYERVMAEFHAWQERLSGAEPD